MDMSRIFPLRLRALREAIGISQEEFAKALGMARATISYYEGGHRTPDITFLDKVHELTGCSLDYLMGLSNTMQPVNGEVTAAIGLSDKAVEALDRFNDKVIMSFTLAHPRFYDLLRIMRKLSARCIENHPNRLDMEAREFKLFQAAGIMREIANDAYNDNDLQLSSAIGEFPVDKDVIPDADGFTPIPDIFASEELKTYRELRDWDGLNAPVNEELIPLEYLEKENWERVKDDPIYKFHQRMTRLSKKTKNEGGHSSGT